MLPRINIQKNNVLGATADVRKKLAIIKDSENINSVRS
jgi:hypothetical protein